jgi:S-adenosylmethionine-diacylglycerol 3-amino-3-carboxypropyl transferase
MNVENTLPPWVLEAKALPLAFSQVREDALQDVALVRAQAAANGRPVRMLMIASGGCTAAALAGRSDVGELRLTDANPAQLVLTRLKLRLLAERTPGERLALLGHTALDPDERHEGLNAELTALGLTPDALGPKALLAHLGPDHAGRYELTFAALRRVLAPRRAEWDALLALDDPDRQARALEGLKVDLQTAFDDVFALENLVALFGPGATANRARHFSEHFFLRTCAVLETLPAASNPYLWQLLAGGFPPGLTSPWLALPKSPIKAEVSWVESCLNDELRRGGDWDLIHLSNILDWLPHEEAEETLSLAWNGLTNGGRVVIRQLNSTLDVPAAGQAFRWDDTVSLHAGDRSFFYSRLHVGQRGAPTP